MILDIQNPHLNLGTFPFKLGAFQIASINIVHSGWTIIASLSMVISKRLLPPKRCFNPKKLSKTLLNATMFESNTFDQSTAYLLLQILGNTLKLMVSVTPFVVLVLTGKMA